MTLNWSVSKEDFELIEKITQRAVEFLNRVGRTDITKRDLIMDLTAAHANGSPLALGELLTASNQDFTHDVFGIVNHLDRRTGALTEGGIFNPRYRKVA